MLCTQMAGQGKVIINEYLPFQGNNCNEFIELYNLGPGTQNIGCYTLLSRNFAITIPANTILNPGQIYLISNTNSLTVNCSGANNANTPVNLNWNNCNSCLTSISPSVPNDIFGDGGSVGDPIILLNTALISIDGFAPNGYTSGTGQTISVPANNGCTSKNLDSDLYGPFESISQNTGRDNSFFRATDGNCNWEKDAKMTPGFSNKNGFTAQINLSLNSIIGCNQPFKINIDPSSSLTTGFNYSWTLSQSPYTSTYQVGTGTYLPDEFSINSLPTGDYNLLLTPTSNNTNTCNDATLSFSISCPTVPIKLISFAAASSVSNNKFEITIDADAELKELILESSNNAKSFFKVADIPFENRKGDQKISFELPASADEFFRIVMIDIFGKRLVSEVIKIKNNNQELDIKVFPNPFQEYISLQHYSRNEDILIACLLSTNGAIIKEENFKLLPGLNNFRMNTSGISKGNYLLSLKKTSSPNIQYNNIIKQ